MLNRPQKNFEKISEIIYELNLDFEEIEKCMQNIFELIFKEDSDFEMSENHYNSLNSYNRGNNNNVNINYEHSFDFENASISTTFATKEENYDFIIQEGETEEEILNDHCKNLLRKKRIGKCLHYKKGKNNFKSHIRQVEKLNVKCHLSQISKLIELDETERNSPI